MSDELKAARERLWRIKLGEDIDDVYQHSPFLSPEDKWDNDRMLMSDEYLIEHQADDDLPATAEWFFGLKFKPGYDQEWWPPGESDAVWYLAPFAGSWSVRVPCGGFFVTLCSVHTRGDVRRLCTALGVPLEEQ